MRRPSCAGRLQIVAEIAAVALSLSACAGEARYAGMNDSSSSVVLRVTASDGQVTDFWLEARAAGRLVVNGTMVTPARVAVLAYPRCSPIFDATWHGDRVRMRTSGAIDLETSAAAPPGQLPLTDRCH